MIVGSETAVLDVFEEKFQRFLTVYEELKAENSSLRELISQGRVREDELQHKLDALQSDYNNLKMTKVLSVSGQDLDDTRKRVSGLVREIDRCIDMLKV